MKTLLLMRHAKSDYPLGASDHDRPLNRRGRLASALMGAFLDDAALVPALAYVSSAARAQETWARMRLKVKMETAPSLYHAMAEEALAAAQSAPEEAETLLILWHQPGIRDCANRLIGSREVHDYPTAQIVGIGFDCRWSDIAFGLGRLQFIASPKSLV